MAQACGEAPMPALAYVAGVDFDPSDEDSVGAVLLATERDAYDRNRALTEENARLRALLADATGHDGDDWDPTLGDDYY